MQSEKKGAGKGDTEGVNKCIIQSAYTMQGVILIEKRERMKAFWSFRSQKRHHRFIHGSLTKFFPHMDEKYDVFDI